MTEAQQPLVCRGSRFIWSGHTCHVQRIERAEIVFTIPEVSKREHRMARVDVTNKINEGSITFATV